MRNGKEKSCKRRTPNSLIKAEHNQVFLDPRYIKQMPKKKLIMLICQIIPIILAVPGDHPRKNPNDNLKEKNFSF